MSSTEVQEALTEKNFRSIESTSAEAIYRAK